MRRIITAPILLIMIFTITIPFLKAQVPVNVYGYVYMPDGSPAAGAKVTISAGGVSKSTTTNSNGKYGPVTLTVHSTPVKISVSASKGNYRGSASKTGEGTVRIDVHLKKKSHYTPPPPKSHKKPLKITMSIASQEIIREKSRIIGFVNNTVVINGSVSSTISYVYIKISYPDGETKTFKAAVHGRTYLFNFTPTIPGIYTISVYYPEDKVYSSANAGTLRLYIMVRSFINLTISPRVIIAGTGTLTIRGMVWPPCNGTITFYYSLDNSTWNILGEVNVTNGVFTYKWKPRVFGDVYIKAVWPGNDVSYMAEAYGRFQTVLPSPASVSLVMGKSIVSLGEKIDVRILLHGNSGSEGWVEVSVYRGSKVIYSKRYSGSELQNMFFIYVPKAPGVYVVKVVSNTRGGRNEYSRVIYVLGEVRVTPIHNGRALDNVSVIIRDSSGNVVAEGHGSLEINASLGSYEILVKDDAGILATAILNISAEGVTLAQEGRVETYPPPISDKPLSLDVDVRLYRMRILVYDAFGNPVSSIKVLVRGAGRSLELSTGKSGVADTGLLPPGRYTVECEGIGSRQVELRSDEIVVFSKKMPISTLTLIQLESFAVIFLSIALSIVAVKYLRIFRKK